MFLREKLRPYTRKLMEEAHEKGTPVMRTLFYMYPQDKKCWDIEDEYLYGPDILVAPILEAGQKTREVYLPAGENWTDSGSCCRGRYYTGIFKRRKQPSLEYRRLKESGDIEMSPDSPFYQLRLYIILIIHKR